MLARLILLTSFVFALMANSSLGALIESQHLPLEQTEAPQVLRDDQTSLSFAQARKSTSWREVSLRKDTYPGFDHAAFWLKAGITSTSASHEQWLITLNCTRWEEIDWYIVRESGEIQHHIAGNARPGRPGIIPGPRPNIVLAMAPSETVEIFLRCRSLARGSLELKITGLHIAPGHRSEGIYFFTFGAIAIMSAIGSLLAFRGKQKGGIAYALSGLWTILIYAGISGLAKSADWPFALFLAMRGGNFFAELALLTALFYLRPFFDLGKTSQWPNLAWRILLIISLIALPLSLIVPYYPFIRFVNLHSALHGVVSVFIAVWAWRQGMAFAKYYVLVWPIFWLALLFDFFAGEGMLPVSASQDHVVAISLVIFQFGIFLVLAERTRAKIREHEAAQDRLIEKEKNLILSLERQVTSRTASLQQATTEAVKANQFKDLFLANIGHEIRTPLSALIGLSQIMVRKSQSANLSADFSRLLSQIHSGGSHLNLMLTNLMDVSTANHGKVPLLLAPIDLAAWSRSVQDILNPLAAARGLTIDWTQNFASPEIFNSDQVRLSQILINLVHNALKFSPDSGSVQVSIHKQGATLTLEILDQGPGLPPDPAHLFTAFAQHDSTLSDAEHGAGLGLHIVQTSLELLHGKIHSTNRPTGGAAFTVTISENSTQP